MARVEAAWPPRHGGSGERPPDARSDERIVALASGLLPGCTLAGWLGVPPAAAEDWAVVLQAGSRRFAVIAERVHMPPRVAVSSIEMLRLREGYAVWLTDAAGARLELVPPAAFAAPNGAGADVPLAVEARLSRAAPTTGGGVALRVGPFSCVLPQEVIGGVHTGLHPGPARGPGAVPVSMPGRCWACRFPRPPAAGGAAPAGPGAAWRCWPRR